MDKFYQMVELTEVVNDGEFEYDSAVLGTFSSNPLEPIREVWEKWHKDYNGLITVDIGLQMFEEFKDAVQKCMAIVEGK
uniref:Uncharacterized protein n=1 Tax=viral metagenome TaxID=1070528 RepID=A0A6H1ZAB6_9ZZZZ